MAAANGREEATLETREGETTVRGAQGSLKGPKPLWQSRCRSTKPRVRVLIAALTGLVAAIANADADASE